MANLLTRGSNARPSLWDDAFEGFFRPLNWIEEAADESRMPAVDVTERENEYLVHAELPGIDKKDINVSIENGVLTISGKAEHTEEKKEGEKVIRRERRYGRFARSLRLGSEIDVNAVKAKYKDGVLELALPKTEAVKPRKINVEVG